MKLLRFYVQILTNVTLELPTVTSTPLATTQWVPMIVSATRDLLEMVSIVQVRIFIGKHTDIFRSILETILLLGLVHADINECHAGSHNCHASASCNNTVGSYDCFCNKGFAGDGVNCSGKTFSCKPHRCFSVYFVISNYVGSRTCRYQRMSHWESHLSRQRHLQQHTGFLWLFL